jgi:hypothetical protein
MTHTHKISPYIYYIQTIHSLITYPPNHEIINILKPLTNNQKIVVMSQIFDNIIICLTMYAHNLFCMK